MTMETAVFQFEETATVPKEAILRPPDSTDKSVS